MKNGEEQSTLHKTVHGFTTAVDFFKAFFWMAGTVALAFVTTLYMVLDPRYVQQAALDEAVHELKCESVVGRIFTLRTEIQIVEGKLTRTTEVEARLQQQDEKRVLEARLQAEKQAAVEKGCKMMEDR